MLLLCDVERTYHYPSNFTSQRSLRNIGNNKGLLCNLGRIRWTLYWDGFVLEACAHHIPICNCSGIEGCWENLYLGECGSTEIHVQQPNRKSYNKCGPMKRKSLYRLTSPRNPLSEHLVDMGTLQIMYIFRINMVLEWFCRIFIDGLKPAV